MTGSPPAASHALPAPGDVLAGKYAVVRVLGEGGMGIVYEARHLRLNQRVAVKMLQPSMLEHEVLVTRFEREARAAGQLRSRHAARITDVDVTAEGLPYMVMELLEGRDLQTELEARGRLPSEEAVDYVLQACAAMFEAHALGIVHRDLKPSNLFLEHDGHGRTVKVLDFGISKVQSEADKLTGAEAVMGTALYMSPEQVRSSRSVDARSDIWSLGVILYELLSGRVPWSGTTTQVAAAIVTEDPPDIRQLCLVPEDLRQVLLRALRRSPDERFPDVRQLALALGPHARVGSLGRQFADSLAAGGAASVPVLRKLEDAPTVLNAAAVSAPRMHPEGGTAPGWTQPQAASRGNAALVGLLVAFAAGLLVLGGIAAVGLGWLKQARPEERVPAAVAEPAPPPAEPRLPPPAIDPPPPPTGAATDDEPARASAPKPIASPKAAPRPKDPKPPPAKTAAPAGAPDNPLHL